MQEAGVTWKDGFATDNLKLAEGQKRYFNEGDYKRYLSLNYEEDRYEALKFLLSRGIKDRTLWEYVYTYATRDYYQYFNILPLFTENIVITVKPNEEGLVPLFRGITSKSAPLDKAFSWTTNPKTARYFARQEGEKDGIILEAYTRPEHILSHITLRKEHELIVHPSNVTLVSKTDAYPIITKDELGKFYKQFRVSGVKTYLTYMFLKERKKYERSYLPYLKDLERVERELLQKYGNFHAKGYQQGVNLPAGQDALISRYEDETLIEALKQVTLCMKTGDWGLRSTILTRYVRTLRLKPLNLNQPNQPTQPTQKEEQGMSKAQLIKFHEQGAILPMGYQQITNNHVIVVLKIVHDEEKVFGYLGSGDQKNYFYVKLTNTTEDYTFKVGNITYKLKDFMRANM